MHVQKVLTDCLDRTGEEKRCSELLLNIPKLLDTIAKYQNWTNKCTLKKRGKKLGMKKERKEKRKMRKIRKIRVLKF